MPADPSRELATDAAPALPRDLPALTSLRFLAAALVLLHHASGALGLPFGLSALGRVGFVGVDFFFVLSGFVLTWSHREGQTAKTFWRHRFVRVYPLHVVGWVLAIGVTLLSGSNQYPIAAWALALVLLQAWVPSAQWAYAANGVSWSLSCEAVFYAAFPWLRPRIAALSPRDLRRLGIALLLAMVAVCVVARVWNPPADTSNPGTIYTNPVDRLGEFAIGIVLARLVMTGTRSRISAGVALVAAGVTFVVVAGVFEVLTTQTGITRLTNPAAVREIGGLLLIPAIAVVLVAAATADIAGRLPRWLGSAVMQRLGRWSFAFYIVHQLVVNTVAIEFPLDTTPQKFVAFAVATVASIALAGVLHHAVEVPFVRRFRGSPPPPVVT